MSDDQKPQSPSELKRSALLSSQQRANRAERRRQAAERRVDMVDLELVSDEELLAIDPIFEARKVYRASYRRLNEAIRKPVKTYADMQRQALLCLSTIRHMEGRGLEAMQIGRTSEDAKLVQDVHKLRTEMVAAATARAKLDRPDPPAVLAEDEVGRA